MKQHNNSFIKIIIFIIFLTIFLTIIIKIIFLVYKYYFNIELFSENNNPSFHILIATIGKESIFNMLESLNQQLNENDYLTIVFDGPNLPNIDKVKMKTLEFKCKVNVIVEEKNLGFWGHAIRNKYNNLEGDFVFHIDDDDNIVPDCMYTLRNICQDKNTIYIFKMDNNNDINWKTKEIILGQIGTPMGIIPTKINPTSHFTHRYGGDFDFYKRLENNGNKIEYIDKVIYMVRPILNENHS